MRVRRWRAPVNLLLHVRVVLCGRVLIMEPAGVEVKPPRRNADLLMPHEALLNTGLIVAKHVPVWIMKVASIWPSSS